MKPKPASARVVRTTRRFRPALSLTLAFASPSQCPSFSPPDAILSPSIPRLPGPSDPNQASTSTGASQMISAWAVAVAEAAAGKQRQIDEPVVARDCDPAVGATSLALGRAEPASRGRLSRVRVS